MGNCKLHCETENLEMGSLNHIDLECLRVDPPSPPAPAAG